MDIQGVEMLTLISGLCHVGLINPIGVAVSGTETSSFCWAYLSKFRLKMETEFSLRNIML
jgi:hypothetical protein